MEDRDIIKALECCTKGLECKNCPANPHKGNYGYCTGLLLKDTLDLINRLQEKDETRHKVFETKCEELEIAKAEIERLKLELEVRPPLIASFAFDVVEQREKAKHFFKNTKAETKAEAYKEFAERLKDIISDKIDQSLDNPDGNNYYITDVYTDIDNLLKKLVGDSNEN